MTENVQITGLLTDLPDEARIWIYAADRDLNPEEQEHLANLLGGFCSSWKSHGRKVDSASAVVEGRFAVLAGLIPGGDVSGCGIDASVHVLDQAAAELGVIWLSSLWVHYRDESGQVRSAPRSRFRELVRSGEVGPETTVFDLNLQTLGELRGGFLERPARNSWHGRVFGMSN